MVERKILEWDVLVASQVGASHVRHNVPNQDAAESKRLEDGSVIVAVADGHGSKTSFRSELGSRIAVEAAIKECEEFLSRAQGASLSETRYKAEQQIPRRIFESWKSRVEAHFKENAFSSEESSLIVDPERRHTLAYGSTLLVAVVTANYLVAFQLGDGDIIAVFDDTRETSYLIEKDNSLIANETTSLCQADACKYFRFCFHVIENHFPALVLLSTDGYANAFASSADFLKVGDDLLHLLRAEGRLWLVANLPGWLEEASREGSGDDITLGIIYRRQPALAAKPPQNLMSESVPPLYTEDQAALLYSSTTDSVPGISTQRTPPAISNTGESTRLELPQQISCRTQAGSWIDSAGKEVLLGDKQETTPDPPSSHRSDAG